MLSRWIVADVKMHDESTFINRKVNSLRLSKIINLKDMSEKAANAN